MPFSNDILAGEELIRSAIRSAAYVAGTTGWKIARDGSAEFNNVTVRGTIIVGTSTGRQVKIYVTGGAGVVEFPINSAKSNESPQIFGAVANAGAVNEYNTLQIFGPSVDGATERLNMQLNSQNNDGTSSANWILRVSGGALILTGDKNVVTCAPRLHVTNFAHATSNASATLTANTNIGVGPSGDVTMLSLGITGVAGRSYEIHVTWYGVLPGAASADLFSFKIKRGASTIQTQRRRTDATNSTQIGGHMHITDTPGAGAVTYNFTANHEGGAGNAALQAAATAPAIITIKGFA